MLQWPYRYLKRNVLFKKNVLVFNLNTYLCSAVQSGEANPVVINFKLVDSIHIRYFEFSFINSISIVFQSGTYKWIDSNKFQLDVISGERFPYSIIINFNSNLINLKIGVQL